MQYLRDEIKKWIDFVWELGEDYFLIKWLIIILMLGLIEEILHLLGGK